MDQLEPNDHQVSLEDQDIIFDLIDYQMDKMNCGSVDFSDCENADDIINKMNQRMKELQCQIMVYQEQEKILDEASKGKNNDFIETINKQKEMMIQDIFTNSTGKDKLANKIPGLEAQNEVYRERINCIEERLQESLRLNAQLHEENRELMEQVQLLQLEDRIEKYSIRDIGETQSLVQNFDEFISFVNKENQ